MKVIRIEYFFQDVNWKCAILATDTKDAIKFLEGFLKAEFRIVGTEEVCTIHGVSRAVMASLNGVVTEVPQNGEKRKGPGRPRKN